MTPTITPVPSYLLPSSAGRRVSPVTKETPFVVRATLLSKRRTLSAPNDANSFIVQSVSKASIGTFMKTRLPILQNISIPRAFSSSSGQLLPSAKVPITPKRLMLPSL